MGSPGSYLGPKGIPQLAGESLEAFPNPTFTREEIIAEGDIVAFVWTGKAGSSSGCP